MKMNEVSAIADSIDTDAEKIRAGAQLINRINAGIEDRAKLSGAVEDIGQATAAALTSIASLIRAGVRDMGESPAPPAATRVTELTSEPQTE